MLFATFNAALCDAVGYLVLDRVFTANMTGNIVLVGLSIGGEARLAVAAPLAALGGFMVGASVTGALISRAPTGWSGHVTASFIVQALVLAATTVGLVRLAATGSSSTVAMVLATAGIALGMGIQASTARKVGVKNVPTVVVTSTMTAFLSSLRTGPTDLLARTGLALLAALCGATAGALLFHVGPWTGTASATLIAVGIALFGRGTDRSRHARSAQPAPA